jgi:hypothetical protein
MLFNALRAGNAFPPVEDQAPSGSWDA